MNTKEFKTYADKEQFVQGVFSNIAKNYDLMNTVLSFGQDYLVPVCLQRKRYVKNQH